MHGGTPFDHKTYYENELRRCGAILEGHFRLKGIGKKAERHGDGYIDKHEILKNPRLTYDLAGEVAQHFAKTRIDVIIGPETGGMLFARHVATQYWKKTMMRNVRILFAVEKKRGEFVLRPEDEHEVKGKLVLIVEDIITTGNTIQSVKHAVGACGGGVVGVGAMVNREGLSAGAIGLPEGALYSVLTFNMPSWDGKYCDRCIAGVHIDDPKEVLRRMREEPRRASA